MYEFLTPRRVGGGDFSPTPDYDRSPTGYREWDLCESWNPRLTGSLIPYLHRVQVPLVWTPKGMVGTTICSEGSLKEGEGCE